MKIVIDATNIKAGGGLTHLKQILENYKGDNLNIEVIGGVWLESIKNMEWLHKQIFKKEFSSLFRQEYFKKITLHKIIEHSNIIFSPGGTFCSKKIPYVSMSQNMLVFEEVERNRFPKSFTWFRYILLERLQLRSFKNASGIIYISNYAKNYIENKYPILKQKRSTVIYHGISDNFRKPPKPQKQIDNYTILKPYRLLYISIINFYKHQWNVIEAVKKLKANGYPIELDLVGPMYKPAQVKLENCLIGAEDFIFYKSKVEYDKISEIYKKADLFVFASTCENMPNILVEAMSAGLPILSSNYGPMPEILKDGAAYMDPLDVDNIYFKLEKMLQNAKERESLANRAYLYSQDFSWEKTAQETFTFITEVYADEVKKNEHNNINR